MAVIRDMIAPFELYQPTEVEDAVRLMRQHGDKGWVLAGGLDTFDWFKDRIKRPEAVIDLAALDAIQGISGGADGGLDIGAMTSLTEIAENADVMSRYPLLAEAAGLVATPQIRNQGTLGGNIVQDTRCWYYRSGWPCYRAGGNVCYAATSQSMNREHCIMGASRCVAVSPSDTAPALVALDAEMVVASTSGERTYAAADFFIGPDIDIERMTVLKPGDLLTRVILPAPVAERALVLREDPRPQVMGLLAGERGVVAQGRGRDDPGRPHRREQRGPLSGAAARGRVGDPGQGAQ